jgi:hypothetical protein
MASSLLLRLNPSTMATKNKITKEEKLMRLSLTLKLNCPNRKESKKK